MEKDNLITDWLDQQSSSEEREELERLISFTEKLEAPALTSKEDAWDNLMANINESEDSKEKVLIPEQKKSKGWIVWAASIAAVLIVGYLGFFNSPSTPVMIELSAGTAEVSEFSLPDQSLVFLNANSTLEYTGKDWASNREVNLIGEAFFEVEEGSTFSVKTPNGTITVLGTSFNVYNRDNQFAVQCFTGSVRIETTAQQSTTLSPGQSVSVDTQSGELAVDTFNPNHTATWRIGEFYFDHALLSDVIEEMERQFNITIEVNINIDDRFYSGFFSKENLNEALQLVFTPMGYGFSVNGSTVTVE